MKGSVLSFLKAEWKVSDTGSAHWAFSLYNTNFWHVVYRYKYTSKSRNIDTKYVDVLNTGIEFISAISLFISCNRWHIRFFSIID